MTYHLLTLALLALAVVCYLLGIVAGATVFIVLGLVCELAFWFRLFKRAPRTSAGR